MAAALFKRSLRVITSKAISIRPTPTLLAKRSFAAQIGGTAPSFTATALVNGRFETVNLEDYKGKWVVLFFYPLDFTFVCPTEITEFSERFQEFEDRKCAVIGSSVDSQFTHLAFFETVK